MVLAPGHAHRDFSELTQSCKGWVVGGGAGEQEALLVTNAAGKTMKGLKRARGWVQTDVPVMQPRAAALRIAQKKSQDVRFSSDSEKETGHRTQREGQRPAPGAGSKGRCWAGHTSCWERTERGSHLTPRERPEAPEGLWVPQEPAHPWEPWQRSGYDDLLGHSLQEVTAGGTGPLPPSV